MDIKIININNNILFTYLVLNIRFPKFTSKLEETSRFPQEFFFYVFCVHTLFHPKLKDATRWRLESHVIFRKVLLEDNKSAN